MTSIERTAFPRYGRVVTARELDALSPLPDEVQWARRHSRSGEHLLGLVVALKCFQRLGYFPRDGQVPDVIVERMRGCLGLPPGTMPDTAQRTAEWQRQLGPVLAPTRAMGLVVWKLGRSPRHLLDTVAAFGERGIAFRSLRDWIDTSTRLASSSSTLFVSGSNDGTVRVWDLASGRLAHTLNLTHRRTRPSATTMAPQSRISYRLRPRSADAPARRRWRRSPSRCACWRP